MSTSAQRRLLKDLKRIQNEPGDEIIASPHNNNLLRWTATIQGIEQTPWQGGLFQLKMQFSQNYPNKPPMVKFISEMFHPNIYNDGRICLDMLQNQWSPVYDVWSILTAIRSLLADPNTLSPANMIASNIFKDNKVLYQQRVREMVEKSLDNDVDEDEQFKQIPANRSQQPQEQNSMELNRLIINQPNFTANMQAEHSWGDYSFQPLVNPPLSGSRISQFRQSERPQTLQTQIRPVERIMFKLPYPNEMIARRVEVQAEEDDSDSSELDEVQVIVANADESYVEYEDLDSQGDGDEQGDEGEDEEDDENADQNNLNEEDQS